MKKEMSNEEKDALRAGFHRWIESRADTYREQMLKLAILEGNIIVASILTASHELNPKRNTKNMCSAFAGAAMDWAEQEEHDCAEPDCFRCISFRSAFRWCHAEGYTPEGTDLNDYGIDDPIPESFDFDQSQTQKD